MDKYILMNEFGAIGKKVFSTCEEAERAAKSAIMESESVTLVTVHRLQPVVNIEIVFSIEELGE